MIRGALLTRVLRERLRGLAGWSFGLVALIAVQVSVYPTIRDSRKGWSELTEQFPEAFRKMFRMEDYTSPTGYLTTELFSFMVPLIFIGLATTWCARAGAEEEENKTADILMTLPISRSSVLMTRVSATLSTLAGMCILSTVALTVGTSVVDMNVSSLQILAASLACALVSLVFGGLSLLTSTWSGRRGVGLGTGLGLAIAMFVTYSLAPLVGFFDRLLPINPFQWTIGQRPLEDGLDPAATTVTLAVFLACVSASVAVFRNHDFSS